MLNRSGNALISTLIIVGVIGVAAVGASQISRIEFQNSTRVEEGQVAYEAALSGIQDGLLRIRHDIDTEVPSGDAARRAAIDAFLGTTNGTTEKLCPAATNDPSVPKDLTVATIGPFEDAAAIPTSQTPYYIRVVLAHHNGNAITQKISQPFNRACSNSTDYMKHVDADVSPNDVYYDLKISYREPAVGQIPGSPPQQLSDTALHNYFGGVNFSDNNYFLQKCPSLANSSGILDEQKIICLMQTDLKAVKIPKDGSIIVSMPYSYEANGDGTYKLQTVDYDQFHFVWEADPATITLRNVNGNLSNLPPYGVQYIHTNGGNVKEDIAFNDQTKSVVTDIVQSGYLASSQKVSIAIPMKAFKGQSDDQNKANLPERIQFKAWGADVWLLAWGTKGGSNPSAVFDRVDTGRTVIESIGQFGKTQRRLSVVVNKNTGQLIEGLDFALFSAAGDVCLPKYCAKKQ